jgi:hypothetical protein
MIPSRMCPFRNVWVFSLRIREKNVGRACAYLECKDVIKGMTDTASVLWTGADCLDSHNPNPQYESIKPQLYNLGVVAYKSLMLGLFSIWLGPNNTTCQKLGIQKRNELLIGYSRDGFDWYRPDRNRFIAERITNGDMLRNFDFAGSEDFICPSAHYPSFIQDFKDSTKNQ